MWSAPPANAGRPVPEGCPDWGAVFGVNIPIKAHVPKGAQQLWGQCLLTALASVTRFNDERSWLDLLAMPKMVLRAASRGGKGHRKRADAETKQRCRRWLEGDRS